MSATSCQRFLNSGEYFRLHAGTTVANLKAKMPFVSANVLTLQLQVNASVECKFRGVGQEIEYSLLQALAVQVDMYGQHALYLQ